MRRYKKLTLIYSVTIAALVVMSLIAVNTGSIDLSLSQLFRGLFIEYDSKVAAVYNLRFPRIFIAIAAGAATSVAGVLLQAVMKNPLADPGILGISTGAGFAAVIVTTFLPSLYFMVPVCAFAGGLTACTIVYMLSWKDGLSPVKIILTGVAVNAMFSGLMSAFNQGTGSTYSGVASIVNGNISMKTWSDFKMLAIITVVGLIAAILISGKCNFLSLEDRTARSIGINVTLIRIITSVIAVLLASGATAIAGQITFLGLIVPHIGRLLTGSDHKVLIPYTAILGAFVFLLADTLGRTIAYPYEIGAAVIMSIAGGPFFIILLRKAGKGYAR